MRNVVRKKTVNGVQVWDNGVSNEEYFSRSRVADEDSEEDVHVIDLDDDSEDEEESVCDIVDDCIKGRLGR